MAACDGQTDRQADRQTDRQTEGRMPGEKTINLPTLMGVI